MKYLLANFKMNANQQMLNQYFDQIDQFDADKLTIKLAIGDLYLDRFDDQAKQKQVELMAQDVFSERSGAYTGQISYSQILDIGINSTLIGHSELRFYQPQALVDHKTKTALANNLNVVLCIGEDDFVYEEKKSISFIIDQLVNVVNYKNLKNLIVAYEPIFAIGKEAASLEHINKVTQVIKTYLYNCTNLNIPVLYGGSVNVSNLEDILSIKCIDGVLVGNASLDVNNLNQMIKIMTNLKDKDDQQ
ncbi:triose-phosphate isomerase [Ureaplasma diversum]|uniref:Triosephosphate isomerase n=1 Tax=Ureaplasma diversum NCTC 246 TaxID=1188241 RepID=A0A084EXA3_9BACT|nr:triose-phosphate isomerase family protein [Ureaplasma diversum]KEZ22595.1 Triosephosphate isomerase [Ureaplasma diversum NCTC 246]